MNEPQLDEKDIFCAALSLESADARIDYLKSVCGSHPEIFERVSRLLQLQSDPSSFLESPAAGVVATLAVSSTVERAGKVIGRYKLRELLGEGGMGSVYVAEQEQPVRRKVALKIIKPGMDSRQVIARFESERQALALMDHPHIAKVLDAGTTEQALPYFVMELVKGAPITEYCDEHKLTTRQRLELVIQVCQAVQHAHQKGIIHRDLKPSNVMVTVHDVSPVVKVIDFGVAKAIGQQLADHTVYTAFSQIVGTPLYMSPEQAGQSSIDIDTRSDVYSLGVLLYELLTGSTPFDKATLQSVGLDEMRRMIREVDPPKPSNKVSTLQAGSQSTLAENRQMEPRRLSRQLRGDLDWIVMKAIEKDRMRRYESASALATDLQNFLDNVPVTAGPPSKLYRMRKFLRRNRQNVILASLIIVTSATLVLLQGISWMGVQSRIQESLAFTRASLDANRLEQAQLHTDQLGKLTTGLLGGQFRSSTQRLSSELIARRKDLDDFEAFNKDYTSIVSQLTRSNHSEDQATSALETYRVLEDSNWLERLEQRHYSREQMQLVRERVYILLVSLAYFRVEKRWGRSDVTTADIQQTLDRAAAFHPKTRGFHLIQAQLYDRLNEVEQREREKQLIEAQPPESSWDYYFAGLYSKTAGRIDDALLNFRHALREQTDHYDSLIMLGDCLIESKPARHPEGVYVFSACAALRPEIPEPYIRRARCYLVLNDKESCKWDLDRAVEVSVWERDLIDALSERRKFFDGIGNISEAKADNDRIIAALTAYFVKLKSYSGKNPYENAREVAFCKSLMGDAQMWGGNKQAALRWYTEAYDEIVELAGESDIRAIDYLQALVNLRTIYGDWKEAVPLLETLVAKNARRPGTNGPDRNYYANSLMLARSYRLTGRDGDAFPILEELHDRLVAQKIEDLRLRLLVTEQWSLIHLNTTRSAHDEALKCLSESFETSLESYGPNDYATLALAYALGLAHLLNDDGPSLISLSTSILSRSSEQLSNVNKASFQHLLSNGYWLVGRTQEALELARQCVATLEKENGRDHRLTLRSIKTLTFVYLKLGQSDLALPLIQELVERLTRTVPQGSFLFSTYTEVAQQLIAAKEFQTAEPILRECVVEMAQIKVEPWERQSATSMFGAALAGLKRFDEAESHLLEGYAGLKELESTLTSSGIKRLKESVQYLQEFYHATGKPDRESYWSRVAAEINLRDSRSLSHTGTE